MYDGCLNGVASLFSFWLFLRFLFVVNKLDGWCGVHLARESAGIYVSMSNSSQNICHILGRSVETKNSTRPTKLTHHEEENACPVVRSACSITNESFLMSAPTILRVLFAVCIAVCFCWKLSLMGLPGSSLPYNQRYEQRWLTSSAISTPSHNQSWDMEQASSNQTIEQMFRISNSSPYKPRKRKLSTNQALFLHIGKAAGGTFNHRVRKEWNVFVEQCHPAPCSKRLQSAPKPQALVVALRDPVDRFVSAFYWRAYMVCHPTQSDWKGPPRGCKRSPREAQTLFQTYNLSASQLAEDLCSADATLKLQARDALATIQHARWSIQDWLAFDWKRDTELLFPLVVERGVDSFEDQTDMAMQWLNQHTQFESTDAFAARFRHLKSLNSTGGVEHSSNALKQDLSPEAEKCLVHYYSQDYEILYEVQKHACKTDACRNGIESILARRKHLIGLSNALLEK